MKGNPFKYDSICITNKERRGRMKKLLKGFIIMLIFNIVIGISFFTWMFSTVLVPAFKESSVTFTDLFKDELDPKKQVILENNLNTTT